MFGTNRERSIGNSFSMSSLFPNFVPKWAWAAGDSPFFHSRHQLERPFLLVTRSTNLNHVLRRVALSLQSRPQSPISFPVPQDKGNVGSGDEIESLARYYAHLLNNKTTDEKISSLRSRKKKWRQESSNKKHDQHITCSSFRDFTSLSQLIIPNV